MSDYIEKRWSKEVMEKRLENLKKIINHYFVDSEIRMAKNLTENELDALYIAYYSLKDRYCKIKRSSFGKPKKVGYAPKKKPIGLYYDTWGLYDVDEWTISSNFTSAASSGIYTYNANDMWSTWSTTTILNR